MCDTAHAVISSGREGSLIDLAGTWALSLLRSVFCDLLRSLLCDQSAVAMRGARLAGVELTLLSCAAGRQRTSSESFGLGASSWLGDGNQSQHAENGQF